MYNHVKLLQFVWINNIRLMHKMYKDDQQMFDQSVEG